MYESQSAAGRAKCGRGSRIDTATGRKVLLYLSTRISGLSYLLSQAPYPSRQGPKFVICRLRISPSSSGCELYTVPMLPHGGFQKSSSFPNMVYYDGFYPHWAALEASKQARDPSEDCDRQKEYILFIPAYV